ncbi:WW domain-containing protein [Plasmodiophora brassicae]
MSSGAGVSRFIVHIADIGASGLAGQANSDSQTVNPFCRIDFANKYRLLQTEFIEDDDAPSWSTTFTFVFATVQCLEDVNVVFSVFDRSDNGHEVTLLGSATIDLYTVATGPVSQDFQLITDDASAPAGHIAMAIEMIQICDRVICCVSNLALISNVDESCNLARARVDLSFSNRRDTAVQSEVIDVVDQLSTRWQQVPPLPISGSVVDLENALINLTVMVEQRPSDTEASARWVQFGQCQLPMSDFHPSRTEIQLFDEKLHGGISKGADHITGTIVFANGPTMSQMLGGANTHDGVHPGALAWDDAPTPSRSKLQGPIPSELPGLDRFSSLRATICWRAPTVALCDATLCITGIRRRVCDEDYLQPLPRGWTLAVDETGTVFFRYHPTKQTTWLDPRYLPPGWEQSITLDGDVFFFSHVTKNSTWTDPRSLPPTWGLTLEAAGPNARPLFVDHSCAIANTSTTIDPRALPDHYSQHIEPETGSVYYKDHHRRLTTWDDPREDMTREDLLERIEQHVAGFLARQMQHAKEQRLTQSIPGPVQERLLAIDDEVAEFQQWYTQSESRWANERDDRERGERAKMKAAEAKLNELKATNTSTLEALEIKWQQEIAAKREAFLAQCDFAVRSMKKEIAELARKIEDDRKQWVEDMIQMKSFAIREQVQLRRQRRAAIEQSLRDLVQADQDRKADPAPPIPGDGPAHSNPEPAGI